ncbi:hypothetical protein F2Q69_00049991 [Brassica cretica]|uniref:RRP12 N-terminal HEAT domain-containing protein n=1 Tax=Brassica cretica TaxID=69181 RepID=A0A8S9PQ86_BRACR|nr:hypothetical protein F2Q69_00049991 [Brassica cretica]
MDSLCLGIETGFCITPSEPDLPVSGDFGEFMLFRLSQSKRPDHKHLCAVIDELSKALAEGNHSRTPVAYFAATCSSLDSLLSADAELPLDVVQPHVVILSLVFPKVSAGVLKRNGLALHLVLSVLRLGSVTPECLISALKCLVHLLTTSVESLMGNEVSEAYSILLNLVTHSDGKVLTLSPKSGLGTRLGLVCIWFLLLEARLWQEAKSNLLTVCLALAYIVALDKDEQIAWCWTPGPVSKYINPSALTQWDEWMNWSRSWSNFCDSDRIVPNLSHSASGPWCWVGRSVMFLFDCWLAGRFRGVTDTLPLVLLAPPNPTPCHIQTDKE